MVWYGTVPSTHHITFFYAFQSKVTQANDSPQIHYLTLDLNQWRGGEQRSGTLQQKKEV